MGRKAFYFALTFLLVVFLLVSCSDKTDEELVDLKINISFGEGRGMLLGSEAPNRESIIWTYKLTKHDKGMTWGEGDEALLNGTLKVSQGIWWVDIWGYRDSECREVVYAGGGEGTVGPEGGILSVTVSTITDPSKAKSFDPSKEPNSTAELILSDLISEKDIQLNSAAYLYWKIDGEKVLTWLVDSEGEKFGNLQGHLYTRGGTPINGNTKIVIEVPAGIHDIQAVIVDFRDNELSSMLWNDIVLEMNCTYKISGVMPVRYEDRVQFFDIIPSWDNVADDQIIVGYAYNYNENQPLLDCPYTVFVDELKDKYTSDELNFRCFTNNSGETIRYPTLYAWIGKDAVLGDDSSLYGVRFDPLATSIKYEQMNSCANVEEVIIHEGIRDIQSYGICALRASVIEIPSSVDFMDYKAFSNDYFDEMIFKNPEGWMIDGEAIDSETLSDPLTAAALYKERKDGIWYRVQNERDCVAVINYFPWVESSLGSPLENYHCYETQMEKTSNSNAYFKIVFLNDGDHTIYIRHDSPSEEDYIIATELNVDISVGRNSEAIYKCSTASFDNSLDAYDVVTYEGVKAGDYCYVEFQTNGDSSVEHGEGYVLIQDKVKVV